MPIPLLIGIGVGVAGALAVKKGVSGYQKHSEADEIVEGAKAVYDGAKSDFDGEEQLTTDELTRLGELKLDIGKDFHRFSTLADSLLAELNKGRTQEIEVKLPSHQLERIEHYAYAALGVLGSIAGAGAAGAAAGFAVYGGVMTFAAASTGTAISSLAGAAATNATLAAIGGGSLAAGGLGIAGGTMILGAAVAAPVLAIAGWAYDSHGDEALSNAKKVKEEVTQAVIKLQRAGASLRQMRTTVASVHSALESIRSDFGRYLQALEGMDTFMRGVAAVGGDVHAEMAKIEDRVVAAVGDGYALAAIMVDLISTPIFKIREVQGDVLVNDDGLPELEKDADGSLILNRVDLERAVEKTLDSARHIEA